MLGFLRRNLRVSNESTKTSAYRSMVRSLLLYCSTVWSPYTQEHIQKIEMVQRRAARYVTNRYHNRSSVTSMLDHLEWETLESRRTKNQLVMFIKIIHGLIDIPTERYLSPASTRTISHHSLDPITLSSIDRSQLPVTIINTVFSLIQYVSGIPSQSMWLRLLVWYLSNGSSLKCHFKLSKAVQM